VPLSIGVTEHYVDRVMYRGNMASEVRLTSRRVIQCSSRPTTHSVANSLRSERSGINTCKWGGICLFAIASILFLPRTQPHIRHWTSGFLCSTVNYLDCMASNERIADGWNRKGRKRSWPNLGTIHTALLSVVARLRTHYVMPHSSHACSLSGD
jgi:hypothetical protein